MTTAIKARSTDLLAQLGPRMYQEAYKQSMSLSALLEHEDPTAEYPTGSEERELDAFGRLLRVARDGKGIGTISKPEAGYWADEFDAFEQDEHTRALAPEWIARTWRRVATGRDAGTRAIYLSGDAIPGSVIQPWAAAAQPRYTQLAPAIPLADIVAITTPIDGDAYRAYYLTTDATQQRFVRVGQGAEVPRVKLAGGEHTVRLHKFGRALEISYEALRRMRIDLVALHIARMAIQAETDKVATAIDVLVNGDGNANTAATSYNLTTLDAATTANNLTLAAWLNFRLQWPNPYMIDTILANAGAILKTQMLNLGSANVPLSVVAPAMGFGLFRPINNQLRDQVAYGVTVDAPANKIVGFDSRFALEYVYEIGGNISEVERFITRQTQAVVLTEVSGFDIFDQAATRVLNLAA